MGRVAKATLDAEREQRPFELTKLDAASCYEAITLLTMMLASAEQGKVFPYDQRSLTALRDRVVTTWPELKPIYEPEFDR